MDWLPAFKTARRSDRHRNARHHDGIGLLRGHRHDPRLQRQQIRETSAVERHRGHLCTADYLAHLRAGGLHLDHVFGDCDFLHLLRHFERCVFSESAIDVNGEAGPVLRLESLGLEEQVIPPHRQAGERINSVFVRYGFVLNPLGFISDRYHGSYDHQAIRVLQSARDAPRYCAPKARHRRDQTDQGRAL